MDAAVGLYVHWPFCLAKCPYCDFNSHVRAGVNEVRWRRALLAELDHAASGLGQRALQSIFFGGGTPSLMAPETVAAIIARATSLFPRTDDLEVTLEANPTSVEAGRFAAYRDAGVNRLSIGVQALDDAALRALGRQHSAAEARAAVELGQRHFPRVSFDMIYARPGQTVDAWARELGQALELGVEHLSLYQLTFEEGTPFGALHAAGRLRGPAEETAVDLYTLTQERCAAAGLPAYEISNHARPGAACRHNILYWRQDDYLALGPGAHGRWAGLARVNHRDPEQWLAAVETFGHGEESALALDSESRAREYALMGLRLAEGLSLVRYEALGGAPLDPTRLALLDDAGLLEREGDRLRATPAGRLVLNGVLDKLLNG